MKAILLFVLLALICCSPKNEEQINQGQTKETATQLIQPAPVAGEPAPKSETKDQPAEMGRDTGRLLYYKITYDELKIRTLGLKSGDPALKSIHYWPSTLLMKAGLTIPDKGVDMFYKTKEDILAIRAPESFHRAVKDLIGTEGVPP
jgi:hypothetical protein